MGRLCRCSPLESSRSCKETALFEIANGLQKNHTRFVDLGSLLLQETL